MLLQLPRSPLIRLYVETDGSKAKPSRRKISTTQGKYEKTCQGRGKIGLHISSIKTVIAILPNATINIIATAPFVDVFNTTGDNQGAKGFDEKSFRDFQN